MLSKIRKIITYILSGSSVMLFACCYGPPVDMTKTIKTQDTEGKPVKGLKITLLNGTDTVGTYQTQDDGMVVFYELSDSAVIEDIDGNDNGGLFEKRGLKIYDAQNFYSVTLKRK